MRTLLALAIFACGIVTVVQSADAARKYRRSAERHYHYDYYVPRYSRQAVECERARHADPGGTYAGYPCWAREALSPNGGRRDR